MKKRKVSLLTALVLALSLAISPMNSFAEEKASPLAKVREIKPEFLLSRTIDSVESTFLCSPLGNAILHVFIEEYQEVGYCIMIDGIVAEFSESSSPFSVADGTGDYLYYDFSCYRKITQEEASQITIDRSWKSESLSNHSDFNFELNRTTYNQLAGVTPHLQGSTNCIVHALSEVLWYWGGISGYSALISGQTFSSLRTDVDNCFDTYYNNWVPFAARAYGMAHGGFWFYGSVNWNPSFNSVMGAIDGGRPCMVGFAAGSEYSSSVGHMTMCYGYFIYSTQAYVTLADGWSTGYVSKLWTTYNDCVITLSL